MNNRRVVRVVSTMISSLNITDKRSNYDNGNRSVVRLVVDADKG
jgi:hypothetical protein